MAARLKTIEIFLNFPIMDINRNVLWHDKSKVDPIQAQRLTEFWGDGSWRNIAYQPSPQMSLFGEEKVDKVDNDTVAEAFQRRLRRSAGFSHVPDPLPMRNSRGATVYYLFFASHKPVAEGIVKSIFDKYRDRGARSR
jgi:three-Cys-motif partner protein